MEALAAEIRDHLGPVPDLEDWPLVSIVVLNRDGEDHLRRLMAGLVERTDYPKLELVFVDNGSGDGSVEFMRSVEAPFQVTILANPHNESFSDANNQGAERADGELLLFLNNDVEPFEPGWLRELVVCHRRSGAGAVGGTLIYPDASKPAEGEGAPSGYRVQSAPARFRERDGMLAVEADGQGRAVFDPPFGEDVESTVAIAACLLIDPKLFWGVGGFTHGYFYGGEDDDLALKLREGGSRLLYSGRSIVVHHVSSTSRELHGANGGQARYGNGLLLARRWGPRVWREWALGRLSGDSIWVASEQESPSFTVEEVRKLGFCLRGDHSSAEEGAALASLEEELSRRGHRHLCLDDSSRDLRGYLYDVAVYLRGPRRHLPAPGQLNVLWALGRANGLSSAEGQGYDLLATSDAELAAGLRAGATPTPVAVLGEEQPAADLLAAAAERADELGFPQRIADE